jgi:SAM-dependent methyltransferase
MARKERRAMELAKRKADKKRRREEVSFGVLELLELRRQEYADAWKLTAAALEAEGHYAWMADLLGGTAGAPAHGKRLLDIGTGSGEGLRILLDRGWRVVSVDENVACLRAAHARCGGTVLYRGSPREAAEGAYTVTYAGGVPTGDAAAVLVEADAIADDELTAALLASGPFDAVTCWMLDTHAARLRDVRVRAIGMRTADEYRIGVQRLVYRLADKVLRGGGVLHVVDRTPQRGHGPASALSEAAAQGVLRVRAAMAQGTSLELLSLDTRQSFVSIRSRLGQPSV